MDQLEKDYVYYVKLFKGPMYNKYNAPKQLRELGDLLKYRRMKKSLKNKDVDKLAKDKLEEVEDLLIDLIKI